MKILFLGTADFSAAVLKKLHSVYEVSGVVTSPDKVSGRGNTLRPSPIKVEAEALGIPVMQYAKVSKEGLEDVAALKFDLAITCAFGQILSEAFINLFPQGVINVHASLLPKYRGASPIQMSVLNGDKETGITIMKTVKRIDAGDILLQKRYPLSGGETSGELFDKLSVLGGEAIVEAVGRIINGTATYTPQNENEATFCSMIGKEDGKIDFSKGYTVLDRFVRGMTPWPSAYTHLDGKMLKVFKVTYVGENRSHRDGEIVYADSKRGLVVAAGNDLIRLDEIQSEGHKRMSDTAFLMGRKVAVGEILA